MKKIGKMGTMKKIGTLKRKPASIVKAEGRRTGASVTTHSYDPDTRNLDVTFHGGRTYRYHDVHPDTAAGLAAAASPGGYLHSSIIGTHDETRDPKKD